MNKKNHFLRKIILLLFFTFVFLGTFAAEDFYWENPDVITNTEARFPFTVESVNKKESYLFWQEVDSSQKQIYLSVRKYNSLKKYSEHKRFAGPFSYSGDEVPDIYTAAVLKKGTIGVAVMTGRSNLSVFVSQDGAKSFTETKLPATSSITIAPRIYATGNDTFKLFTSVGEENSFTIFSADSSDGVKWSRFSQFSPAANYRNPFIPVLLHSSFGDIVVFQAQYTSAETGRLSYQLYMTVDSGKGWSAPVLVTDRQSLSQRMGKQFYEYQNQRPYLFEFDGLVYLAWERTDSVNSSIWIENISSLGVTSGSAEKITDNGNASRPVLFSYNGALYMTWFDTRRGRESVYMAKKDGSYWNETRLAEDRNSNMFVYPLLTLEADGNKVLSFIWQQKNTALKNSIAILSPDKSVLPPTFTPLSFKKGKRSRSQDVQIQINFPSDSSNISGYSYTWSYEKAGEPVRQIEHFTKENKLRLKASQDGTYILAARVADYAGNWSEVAQISYQLDLTPPEAPKIALENLDKYGFLDSNNYNLKWKTSASNDVSQYLYKIDYLGSIPKTIAVTKNHKIELSAKNVSEIKNNLLERYKANVERSVKLNYSNATQTDSLNTARFYNRPNGVYMISVCAVDEVGNIGQARSELFILNKYEPSTYVTSVQQAANEMGDSVLTILGGGFTYDGTVSKIFIDADGQAPYDLELSASQGKFRVQSDSRISGVQLGSDLDEGSYKVGLLHTDRGLYFTGTVLKISQNGTLKIESDYLPENHLKTEFRKYKYKVAISLILIFIIIMIAAITFLFIAINLHQNIREKKLTQSEINSLYIGAAMPLKNLGKNFRRLPSLKKKLIAFAFSLVIAVVIAVTLENGYKVIRLQEQTMAAGLENRTEVLLESLHSGVKNFFPANNLLELTALPGQKDAMDEVKYVTIIGQKLDSSSAENLNYIWATNDPDINLKTKSYSLIYGESEISEKVILEVTQKLKELDKEIAGEVLELSNKIDELSRQAQTLYASVVEEDTKEAERLSDVIVELRNQLDSRLAEYSKAAAGSYPAFDAQNLDRSRTDYIFYRPVMYRKGTSGNYIHSVIYLELSTQSLIDSLNAEIRKIVMFSLVIAAAAVAFGIVGAYVFASLIVRPIKKLEKHVIMIGQTKNKINLKGKDVEISSKDEVGRLGDAVNNMTHELVANAEEEALAMDGKAVQKAFLPLEALGANNKNTYAEYKDNELECFGYYEGESGVSGDYFDYKRLDDTWFCIIKCDVSGHGIPAAIIMTVVATIFRRYFQKWTYAKNGTHLNKLVEQINDFIEGLGLRGKFATLIICLLNVKTGELYMCNAGDNLVHIYDSKTRTMKLLTLASAPTAGVFTSDLVAMRGGFVVEKTVLNHGDILFLYTDGIEESTRRIRETDYSVRQNEVEVKKMNPKTHEEEIEIKLEDAKEEFGPERIKEAIEAVYNKRKFTLSKLDNPAIGEVLEFDFTKCEGTVSEAIVALASLEKVFRLYKSDKVTQTDYIRIDKKIDEFLSKYFNMYDFYAAHKVEDSAGVNYVDYDQMLEDEQSDDLTLLAIKRC
ncbi:MAG: SpoIIE family protein phosphatase [Treponema sp.]|nr:SpoIIE family protein phosphatase [Treponema sp.]